MVLEEKNLEMLNDSQRKQVLMQRWLHQHKDFQIDLAITPFGEILEGFIVQQGVWNPTIVSARHHAAYLFYHNGLYYGKKVIDIGSGTGLMGIVMAKYGAKKVIMSDISKRAVSNSQENIKHFKLDTIASAVEGDLFAGIEEKADCITFMQPYFAGNPPEWDTISASMLANPELIRRFLQNAPNYLKPDGVIVMPSFSLAGALNDPVVIGKEYWYNITTTFITDSTTGLQQGEIAMHELRIKK